MHIKLHVDEPVVVVAPSFHVCVGDHALAFDATPMSVTTLHPTASMLKTLLLSTAFLTSRRHVLTSECRWM